jgi:uncharacterized protein (TIGR03086 family)
MDPITRLDASVQQAQSVVDHITVDQYRRPTPCADWDVGAVINHMLQALVMFRESGEKGRVDLETLSGDLRGDDAAEAIGRIGGEAVAAWSAPGKLDEVAHLPFGDFPAAMALQLPAMDMVVHSWDLAQATDAPAYWDAALVEDTWAFVSQAFADPAMRGDDFGDPVPVSDDADALTKTVAFLGRTP